MDNLIKKHILWEYWIILVLMIISIISSLFSLINTFYLYISIKVPALMFIDLFGIGEIIIHINTIVMIALFLWLRKLKERLNEKEN